MIKLARYLKPFLGLLLISVVLLFLQAYCDLALPDYMSKIVNVGIQQSGVETAIPIAIREKQMNKVAIFLSDEDKKEVLNNYTLISKESKDYDKYLKTYSTLDSESIYILNDIDKEKINKLNPILGKAIISVSGIEKLKDTAKDGKINFNGKEIPSSTDLFAAFKVMPSAQKSEITAKISEQFSTLGDKMIIQGAANPIKEEYIALKLDTTKMQSKFIFKTGYLMILLALIGAVATVIVGYLSSKAAAGFSKNLRRDVFRKVESFSNAEFDKFSTASLITRSTNDITQIQQLIVMMMRMIVYAPILGIGGVIKAVQKNSSMSWIIALAVIIILLLIIVVFIVAMPKFKLIQKLIDRLNLVTRENLSGMMVIRAFNTEKFQEKRFDKANVDLTNNNLFVNRIMVVMMPAMMLVMNGVSLLIVWVGSHQIAESNMQVGDMMAFMQYAMQIIFAFLMMSIMFIMIPRASVSAGRISEVLEIEPTINDIENPKVLEITGGSTVEFNNVCFKYPGAEECVIKDISFKALPGKTTAIIGSTGSGKTTLINLIPRFYDVTGGEVLIDGIDIRNVSQENLRDKIGYIPQKGSLFQGTIESNLKYARENATEEEILEALETSQSLEFVKENENGIKGSISQGGENVSGGQKQRLSIARALVKKPDIYIFDDSFSALDFKTDAALRRALKSKTLSSTILIVAQRISTILNADNIIVLDEGKIVGIGTHRELMITCDTYKEIALSQLSKEELA